MKEYFLKTDRMGFSYWTLNDLELAMTLWGEPDVTHFISAKGIFTEEEIRNRLNTEIENLNQYGIQYFPIFELDGNELIGCCGLRPFTNEKDIFEMGFHLRKKYWKQGFAFEAATAVLNYSSMVLHAKELKAGHHPSNTASKKLLQRLGFQYESDKYYEPTGLYHPSYHLKLHNQ